MVAALVIAAALSGCVREATGGSLRQEPVGVGSTSLPVASGPVPPPPRSALPTDPSRSPLVGVRWTLVELNGPLSYGELRSIGAWFLLSGDGTLRFSDGTNDGSGRYTLTPDGFETQDVFSSAVGYGGLDVRPYRVLQAMRALLRGARAEPAASGMWLTVRAGGYDQLYQAQGSQPEPAAGAATGSVAPQPVPTPESNGLRHPVCTPGQLRRAAVREVRTATDLSLAVVTLANAGRRTCSLVGYPYVTATDDKGSPVRLLHGEGPLPGVPDPGPRVVEVPPGGHAWFVAGAPRFYERNRTIIGALEVVPGGHDAAPRGGARVPVTVETSSDTVDVILVVTAYAAGEAPALLPENP